VNCQDFILEIPNFINSDYCKVYVEYFHKMQSLNLAYSRQQANDGRSHQKQDTTAFLMAPEIFLRADNPLNAQFVDQLWKAYDSYADHFSILRDTATSSIQSVRLQKTEPGEGYHVWHFETMRKSTADRHLSWMLYLNDVAEGGETEFLYQKRRVAPRQGTLLIWPSGFTHTHRGNPPLTEVKYILTGWFEYNHQELHATINKRN